MKILADKSHKQYVIDKWSQLHKALIVCLYILRENNIKK